MIDLHTHSIASDGSLTPSELVQAASKAGITYLALTDHNTVNGLPEFLAAAKGASIQAVPGMEITCELEKTKFHILAMNLPEHCYGRIQSFVDDAASRSEMSKRTLVQNLQQAGYDIDFDEIKAKYPDGKINRSRIGRELVEKGYVETVSEAMGTLLNESAGYYQPVKRLNAIDTIHEIIACEAIPVWAHPFLELDTGKVNYFLKKIVPEGLVGMEVYCSTYTNEQTKSAKVLAEKYHLKVSGGSDFHGSPKPDIQIGVGRGNLNIPESVAEELLRAIRRSKERLSEI